MLRTLWNGRAGLFSNQNRMDVISNNIANTNTNGYKRMDVSFKDLVYDKINSNGLPTESDDREGLLQGTGSRADILVRDTKQGVALGTGVMTDMAIDGSGYFRLISRDENGNTKYLYTRDGSFRISEINGERCFIHSSGYMLDIESYEADNISDEIFIRPDGELFFGNKSSGKIRLYNFKDLDGIVPLGDNLFYSEGEIEADGKIMQGYLEASNVDIAKELVNMIITQRAFQLNSKSITAGDEMWQQVNNLRGR